MAGRSIAVFADTGEGKTTQFGELAKFHFKRDRRPSVLHLADKGGYASINPLVKLGVVIIDPLQQGEDPWGWTDRVTKGLDKDGVKLDVAVHGFDSGTGLGELLLANCADLSAAGQDIGGRPAPKFKVKIGKDTLNIGSNVDSHYNVVQQFLLKKIWQSTYLTEGGDVYWTFSVLRGEDAGENAVLGPMLAGRALTPKIPKWFDYTFRLGTILDGVDTAPRHVLYLTTHLEGMNRTLGNSRYPIDAATKLPESIEPASITRALELFEQGEVEAEDALREELGL